MTSGGWQDSHSQVTHHTHTTVKDPLGHDLCTVCHQIVITPILSSDDPRLQPAEPNYPPLPEMLVTLYYDGPDFGYYRAPVAPYVRDVASLEGNKARYNSEDLWDILSEKVEAL